MNSSVGLKLLPTPEKKTTSVNSVPLQKLLVVEQT